MSLPTFMTLLLKYYTRNEVFSQNTISQELLLKSKVVTLVELLTGFLFKHTQFPHKASKCILNSTVSSHATVHNSIEAEHLKIALIVLN